MPMRMEAVAQIGRSNLHCGWCGCSAFAEGAAAQVIGKQVLRSGTSVAANFREASRTRSDAEFVAKMGIVEQNCDETMIWFELLMEGGSYRRRNCCKR